MTHKSGIEQALEKFDNSPTKLATAIGGSVLRQHIEHWIKSGKVPAEKAADVMLASGVPLERLSPDVNWDSFRSALQVSVR